MSSRGRAPKRPRVAQLAQRQQQDEPSVPGQVKPSLFDTGVLDPLRDFLTPRASANLASASRTTQHLLHDQKKRCADATDTALRCVDPEGWAQIATGACPVHWVAAYCLSQPQRWLIPYLARFAKAQLELRVSFESRKQQACVLRAPLASGTGLLVKLHGYSDPDLFYLSERVADDVGAGHKWVQARGLRTKIELGTLLQLGVVKGVELFCGMDADLDEDEAEAFESALGAVDWRQCSGNAKLQVLACPGKRAWRSRWTKTRASDPRSSARARPRISRASTASSAREDSWSAFGFGRGFLSAR